MNIFQGIPMFKTLYETTSPYNGAIRVTEFNKTRKLIVDNIMQSLNWDSPACQKLYWGKTVEILKEQEPNMQNILILGLGGGTLAHLIRKAFPETHITSVDIDNIMYDVAKKFFDLDAVQNHTVIIENAMKVVVEPTEYGINEYSQDVLMVDILVGEAYPDLGKSGNFIGALRHLVKPGGLVIFERIYTEHHQDDVNAFIEQLGEFLTDIQSEVVAGYTNSDNVMIYGRTAA